MRYLAKLIQLMFECPRKKKNEQFSNTFALRVGWQSLKAMTNGRESPDQKFASISSLPQVYGHWYSIEQLNAAFH